MPQHPAPDTFMERARVWTERHLFFTRVALFYANRALGYRELTVRDVVTRADAEIVAHTLAGDSDRTKQWQDIFESIGNIQATSAARGIEFALTLYPWAHQISETEWVPGRFAFMPQDAVASDTSYRTIKEMSAARGIPLVDLYPTFKASLGPEPLYFAYDMHWTAAGHRVIL